MYFERSSFVERLQTDPLFDARSKTRSHNDSYGSVTRLARQHFDAAALDGFIDMLDGISHRKSTYRIRAPRDL
jgi:hypothetical protein